MIWCVARAGISEKVGTKPVGVEVLGMKLVLFRGSDGTVHCLHGAPCLACCPSVALRLPRSLVDSLLVVDGRVYIKRISHLLCLRVFG